MPAPARFVLQAEHGNSSASTRCTALRCCCLQAEHDELMAWAEELGVSEEAFGKVQEDGGLAILQEVRSIQAARVSWPS